MSYYVTIKMEKFDIYILKQEKNYFDKYYFLNKKVTPSRLSTGRDYLLLYLIAPLIILLQVVQLNTAWLLSFLSVAASSSIVSWIESTIPGSETEKY